MPQSLTVYKKIDGHRGDPLFSCCLNSHGKSPQCSSCGQCTGTTRRGTRCQQKTCRDADFCHHHLKRNYNVVINISRIPHAGLGLFCVTSQDIGDQERRNGEAPVFRRGSFIVPYGGHELKQSTLDLLYDYIHERKRVENAGPYAIQSDRDDYVFDGLCYRRAGAYVNDYRHSGKTPNARLWPDGIRAIKNIYKGDEIYVDYGDDYWRGQNGLDVSAKPVRVHRNASRTGLKGRYVRNGVFIPIP